MKTANTLYTRYAKDLTESLFNSIYDDLYKMAMRSQEKAFLSALKTSGKLDKSKYQATDSQIMLTEFCNNKISLGMVMDHIKIYKDYI